MFLAGLRLLEAWRLFGVKGVDFETLLHRLCTFFGENPGVGTTRVKDSSHFLGLLAGADVQLSNV